MYTKYRLKITNKIHKFQGLTIVFTLIERRHMFSGRYKVHKWKKYGNNKKFYYNGNTASNKHQTQQLYNRR